MGNKPDSLNGQSEQRAIRFLGDQGVGFEGRDGTRYSIQKVGIGHPMHTVITPPGDVPRGRLATDAEREIALLLVAENEAQR